MNKEQWIEQFALQAMASYEAVNYDDNCRNGWGEKEQFLQYEDALELAQQSYERMIAITGEVRPVINQGKYSEDYLKTPIQGQKYKIDKDGKLGH